MGTRSIVPLRYPPDVEVELPGSKSITNRALLLAALASGRSTLERVLFADDTEAMLDCITALGAGVEVDRQHDTVSVEGIDGAVPDSGRAHARQSGTTARFVAPVLALGRGTWELSGDEQLAARPMGDLFSAMRGLGVTVAPERPDRSLPASITGPLGGGSTTVSGSTSSQFLSGLLLAGPLLEGGLSIEVTGRLVSRPYVEMTIEMMRRFGAVVTEDDRSRTSSAPERFVVDPGRYRAVSVAIEPDASGASYFFAAALAAQGRVRVPGLSASSVQGDVKLLDVLEAMGAQVRRGSDFLEVAAGAQLHGVEADLTDCSDTFPTLAVLASLADSPTRITGVGFIRNKESDRIAAVATELSRLGIVVEEEADGVTVHPGRARPGTVATYGDHRIAMAFSVLGLVTEGIEIDDPGCVDKTFPTFFDCLERLRS